MASSAKPLTANPQPLANTVRAGRDQDPRLEFNSQPRPKPQPSKQSLRDYFVKISIADFFCGMKGSTCSV
ncbi:MAG: hypothetical protein RLZZ405_608 [Verrucomicrobiota bacterium]